MCESEFNLVLSLDACAWAQFLDWRHPISDLEITDYRTPIDMVLLKVIKYLVGCVARVCNELSQNMCSLNKMFKYHLLEVS
ncbi:uncharacterized protein LOC116655811 [Drosophila ananassae]|uniref:uncharacterized protein LOC116655811 n=1 Tax=Drosophila ananassae TaxID=7217 RepID=UPI000177CBE2|nr:uncharacterized protein LOC116655811 [Drosophila ananassae]